MMAPPAVLDVSPETLAAVARSVFRARETVSTALDVHHGGSADWAAMAGSDAAGEKWGTAYDADASDILRGLGTIVSAATGLGRLIDRVALNHAAAESIAGSLPVPGATEPPPVPSLPSGFPSAVGDLGPGLQGAVELADAVGVPCPNGNTEALRSAAESWMVLGRALLDARSEILGAAEDLGDLTSPEIDGMHRDLRNVADAVEAAAGACSGIAATCRDFADRLEDTRREITDLLEQFAVEEAASIALGIGLAFVSAGLSAAAGAAVAAGRFARTASRVRAVVAAFQAYARTRRNRTSMETMGRTVDDIEEITSRTPVDLDAVPTGGGPVAVPTSPPGWSSARALEDHFARHGADVGARSADEYAEMAARFRTDGTHEVKIGPDGTVRMYDAETNTFAAYTPDGMTKTYFKPGSGSSYWDRQPGVVTE